VVRYQEVSNKPYYWKGKEFGEENVFQFTLMPLIAKARMIVNKSVMKVKRMGFSKDKEGEAKEIGEAETTIA